MKLESGSTLGAYEIISLAGAGGMGEVYRARDSRLGREVAIKLLPQTLASDPERLARFEREARTVAILNHPNIVVLHSIEDANGVRFITMEMVEGQSLDRLITPGGLPMGRVLDIAIPLSDALVAAHERGVVHRDLKPGNVMITREGRVKVLDFGLAKQAGVSSASTDSSDEGETQIVRRDTPVSVAGQIMGTVQYMAPEQLRGDLVDARSDLFSLGIILYELATGKRPFVGSTSADIGSAILRDIPQPLQSIRSEIPNDLQRIVSRCLEKDRERRFQTAKDVRNELELVQRTLDSAPPSQARQAPAHHGSSSNEIPSIAVLPFVNRSRDEEDEYFSDGLADELLNLLAKIRGLRVAARTSSYFFKGKNEDLAVIGQKLNVATLLEGSVRKAGNRVRITVQLVKVADGFHLWSETYDRTLDDIFALQDDIAQSVVKELRTTLMGELPDSKASGDVRAAVEEAAKGRGDNAEAYRLYLQGRHLMERYTKDSTATGISYLEQAIAIDPSFALAWVWLSHGRAYQAGYSWIPIAEGYRTALEAAQKAITLEPELAEAYCAAGEVLGSYYWDWQACDEAFRRALALAPNNASALRGAGHLALAMGNVDYAIELSRRALMHDPLSASAYSAYAIACRMAGLLDDAIAAYRKVLELAPHRAATHMMLALTLNAAGRGDEAALVIEHETEGFARLCGWAIIYASAGRLEDSDRALQQLIDENSQDAMYQIAAVYSVKGDRDAAFHWLERGYALHDPGMTWMKAEPTLRPLHEDPRWLPFLRKMKLID